MPFRWASLLFFVAGPVVAATGSQVCATCHRSIYDSYMGTAMATSSGTVRASQIGAPGTFIHAPSGVRYRVYPESGKVHLGLEQAANGAALGSKLLLYFIGSGQSARGYLLENDGFLFQAPVTWYRRSNRWDLAPNYERYAYPYLTRPVQPGCLTCHASFLNPIAGTQNRYADPPFGEGGVACERCHGEGGPHVLAMRSGRPFQSSGIINPVKLSPERRDSICLQCHLTGEVRVMAQGASWHSFRPGDRLSDSVSVFVRPGRKGGMKVTSHGESLAQSACKQASGDRLWCGTCHDPHTAPAPAVRMEWFRGKCLTCHQAQDCGTPKAVRLAAGNNCISCHMPQNSAADAEHVVSTDHSIPARPQREAPVASRFELIPFGGARTSKRDLDLGYAIAASRGSDAVLRKRAISMLEAAIRSAPADVELLLYLAEAYRKNNQEAKAVPLYRHAIRLDPSQVTGAIGLAAILLERGELDGAIRLFQDALSRNAGLNLSRTNLAIAYWRKGDRAAAESALEEALTLNPGFTPAVDLLRELRSMP